LLADVYLECLKREFNLRQIRYRSRISVRVEFKGAQISTELWCDFFVESCLTVSVHSMAALAPIHSAQMLAYMKLLGAPKGIIVNFNCTNIYSEGQKTLVNESFRSLPDE